MDKDLGMRLVRVELSHVDRGTARILKNTIAYSRDVVSFLVHVACDHLSEFRGLNSMNECARMEQLVHVTKDNPVVEYPKFDKMFNRYPSYMRRSDIHAACGHVRSHDTRCEQYYNKRKAEIDRGHHFRHMEPHFTYIPNTCPTLYKNQTIRRNGSDVEIKVYKNGAWKWLKVSIPKRDMKCLVRARSLGTVMNPKLVYAYHKFYLEFPVKQEVREFPDADLKDQAVLGVDLGLNNGAVCSVCDYYGSIRGRHFSPFRKDMARIDHIVNLIRKKSATSGKGQSLAALYTKLEGLKDNYTKQLARWIVNKAIKEGVYGIVLEHLNVKGHARGNLAARIQHWCTARIRDYIKGMALREGIRVFTINAKGTSMYAFDGSGKVDRSNVNYSRCTFASGKRYNCDLSASYNIGARYFLREIKKSMPETAWSDTAAKAPGALKRTEWTPATLKGITFPVSKAA